MNQVISVIIPCYNEEKYIEACIGSALKQTFPFEQIEVLVVDGMSSDRTREIVKGFSQKYQNIRLLDNPLKVTPAALNTGIRASSGEYICIWGAHSEYDEKFLENSMKQFIKHPEISCTGGPIISVGKGNFGTAAALAMASSIGVGNAKHRFPDYEGYAEMACFPVFKKEVFEKHGLYDENLIRNQDDEFCFRLRLNGDKIFISPEIRSIYYTRSTPGSLFRQYFNYGFWRIAVLKKHRVPISLRQQVPALFFLIMLILFLAGIFNGQYLIGLFLPVFYIIVLSIFALKKAFSLGLRSAAFIPLAIFILHFSYAAGFVKGISNFILKEKKTKRF